MANSQLLTLNLVSTPTTVTRVLIPEGTILPAVGIWRRKESGRKITYILDTSRSHDDWLALAFTGRILWRLPEDGIEPVVFDANLFVGYAKPGTWLTLQFGNGVKAPVRILPHVPRV